MRISNKSFRIANAALISAMTLAMFGCGSEIAENQNPSDSGGEQIIPGNDFVVFNNNENAFWPAFDSSGASTPTYPMELGDYGLVTEFSVVEPQSVLGYQRATDKGALDISAFESTGTLEFEIKLVSQPTDGATTWYIKLESNGGSDAPGATGESVQINIDAPVLDSWQKVTVNIEALANEGLDLTSIDNIMIFPAWDTGAGAIYRIDNIGFNPSGNEGVDNGIVDPDTGYKLDLSSLEDFDGAVTVVNVADPALAVLAQATPSAFSANTIMQTTKTVGAQDWAGVNILDTSVLEITPERSKVSVWLYSPYVGAPVLFKVQDAAAQAHDQMRAEAQVLTTLANEWEKLTFDFTDDLVAGELDPSYSFTKKSIFFDYLVPAADQVFYWQDVTFVESDGSAPVEPVEPPTEDLIVLFGDAANPAWAAWDCCGGTTPSVVTDADPAYGAVTEFQINGGTVVGFTARDEDGAVGGAPVDVSAWSSAGTVSFDLKLTSDNGAQNWAFKVESVGGTAVELPLDSTPELNVWKKYQFNLSDLAAAGVNLSAIDLVMMFPIWDTGDGAIFSVDNVQFSSIGNDSEGGEGSEQGLPADLIPSNSLIINGAFSETGQLEPWFQVGAGQVTVADGVANLVAPGGETRIKQMGIGQGNISANQTVELKFSVRGSAVNGGVSNGVIHIIGSDAGVKGTQDFSFGLTNDWTEHTVEFTTGGDAASVDLTVGAVCGAVAGCNVDFDIDNISMVVTQGSDGGDGEAPDSGDGLPEDQIPAASLVVNGAFTGDLLAPWTQVAGGDVSVANGFATIIAPGGESRIKQTGIGQGTLAPNQSIQLKFSARGSAVNGGVTNGIIHIIGADQAVKHTEPFSFNVGAGWVEHTVNLNSGSDAASIDLTIGAVCGAVANCQVDLALDNISIVVN